MGRSKCVKLTAAPEGLSNLFSLSRHNACNVYFLSSIPKRKSYPLPCLCTATMPDLDFVGQDGGALLDDEVDVAEGHVLHLRACSAHGTARG
eukprot:1160550-Pelagomonas_calceolata.AAC.6